MSNGQFMRLIVLFDLPVTSKINMHAANRFRNFLKKDGYQMLQLSVYARLVRGREVVEKHRKRLKANLPPEGQIRCLEITEKQFANINILVGQPTAQEKKVNGEQLLLF